MEPLTETISLDIDESNELAFRIKMEGTAAAPAKVRLVCEGEDFAYMFNGYGTGEPEVVQFTLPRMGSKISEGSYAARVEVLVENRYFAPLQFQIEFKKTLSVVAEAIQVKPRTVQSDIKVTATPLVASKPQVKPTQIVFEQRPAAPQRQPEAPKSSKAPSLREAYAAKASTKDEENVDEATVRRLARTLLADKLGK